MRLGEIKKNIEVVLDEKSKIKIDHEAVYGGQAQSVKNFVEIIEAVNILMDQSWNVFDVEKIKSIKKKYSNTQNPVILEQADFNLLNSYISELNGVMHLFYGILGTMVEE